LRFRWWIEQSLSLEGTKSMTVICSVRGTASVTPDPHSAIASAPVSAVMPPQPLSGGAVQTLSSTMLADLLGQQFLLYGSYSAV
jgi:hypothetical protein